MAKSNRKAKSSPRKASSLGVNVRPPRSGASASPTPTTPTVDPEVARRCKRKSLTPCRSIPQDNTDPGVVFQIDWYGEVKVRAVGDCPLPPSCRRESSDSISTGASSPSSQKLGKSTGKGTVRSGGRSGKAGKPPAVKRGNSTLSDTGR
ncbi:hypothetical protein BC832DRAFT_553456 [Gaertneriomyces semiglobifer]|nr:hypothetical protein BC832DRAFT_553456 [Gaertneriomyces semiglobifer]